VLLTLQPRYPDVEIKPFHADFRTIVDQIMGEIPRDAFAFVLLDPKGWRIPIATIQPLLRRPNTEVVFNFIFEFINRAASMSATDIVEGLDELLPAQGWRAALEDIDLRYPERDRPPMRRQILIDTFRKVLARKGNYGFVAETPVMRPLKNSMLYALVYATRAAKGIEVFRDCQLKTLREQEAVRGAARQEGGDVEARQLFRDCAGPAPRPPRSNPRRGAKSRRTIFFGSAPGARRGNLVAEPVATRSRAPYNPVDGAQGHRGAAQQGGGD
jgi:hypothetical protein